VRRGLYSEAVISSAALAEASRFKEVFEHVQRAAKALYEAAKEVFEHVKVAVQCLVELFVEAAAWVLTRIDEQRAYLFLKTAVAAGAVALSAALNLWGLIELGKSAYASSLTPFVAGLADAGERATGVGSREEMLRILRSAPDPYEKFREIAKAASAENVKLAEPWESLRMIVAPKPSEERRLMHSKAYRELDEGKKKALFYAALALEEAFAVYSSALRKYAAGLKEAMQKKEVGEEPLKRVAYLPDLGRLTQLAEEESKAFGDVLKILREKLNEYAVRHGLRDLLDVNEYMARRLAEAKHAELSEFSGASFGVKALAALIAYRDYALGRRGAFGIAAGYWLEVGGSAWLLYYAPDTAYVEAIRAKVERPAAVEEAIAEAFRRLFLKPGADHYRGFVELLRSGKLALMLENEAESSYVFKLYKLEEGGKLKELDIKLWISKVGEGEEAGITYTLVFKVKRWREFFAQKLDVAEKAAEEVGGRLPVEDRLPYMLGWVNSDVAITRNKKGERVLQMSTSHLWQLAETHALFDWSKVVGLRMSLTLEGPKLAVTVEAPLEKLDAANRESTEGGWLHMLETRAKLKGLKHVKSWDDLKRWVAGRWGGVVEAAARRLGEEVRGELEALRDKLKKDKVAREVIAPALLLIQAERLGVNETTLRYLGAVISGAIGGDGYVSAAEGKVVLTSGERGIALLWAAVLAAHGIKAEVGEARDVFYVVASGGDAVKYNVYLRGDAVELQFRSTDRSRVELAARLLRLVGVGAEVRKEGGRDVWRVRAYTDMLAAGREELRKALAKIVKRAVENGWVDANKAEGWLEELEEGRVLKEGWPKYNIQLTKGALVVRFSSPNPDSIEREAQRLEKMGLKRGVHFSVKMPEGGDAGYLYILREGLAYAAWLSVYGSGEQQWLAAEFVEYILQRAGEEGENVRKKAEEIVEEGKAKGSLTLKGFERAVEVGGREHVVRVIDGGAELEESRRGKKLLRIRITAEVDGVEGDYMITFGRRSRDNAAVGFAVARADAPGGREADAERLAAVVEALTGRKPWVYRKKNGKIMIECYEGHLEGFSRYAELADAIERWLEETSRR